MKHQPVECHCGEPHCPLCIGGLFICQVCGAAEGELATECPGEPLSQAIRVAVWDGVLDFKDGKWWHKLEKMPHISLRHFTTAMGRPPRPMELNRVNCPYAGCPQHKSCGWCDDCQKPRLECNHWTPDTPSTLELNIFNILLDWQRDKEEGDDLHHVMISHKLTNLILDAIKDHEEENPNA